MKYIDGAQNCITANCDIGHWGWSNAIEYNCSLHFAFRLKTQKKGNYCRIEILTKRNKNTILLVCSKVQFKLDNLKLIMKEGR